MNAILSREAPSAKAPVVCLPTKIPWVRQTLVLLNRQGLHCRPAALFVKTLADFNCKMTVECRGVQVDGRSILGLLSLAAGYGTRLTFVASGPDAEVAMTAIRHLFADNFAGAYGQVVHGLSAKGNSTV
ncbi:MAG TPA: HPr family phosphocarrier protein [Candidatus Acidoferrales bacterium]|nr:HPr family phosphocarrier protein [Candidatus Acidoferrales bacterium]